MRFSALRSAALAACAVLVILHICANLALFDTLHSLFLDLLYCHIVTKGFCMVKRVNVTLSDDHYETLKAYSAVVGRSPTRLVGDMLIDFMPSFSAMVAAARLVDANKSDAVNQLNSLFLDTLHDAVTAVKDINKV